MLPSITNTNFKSLIPDVTNVQGIIDRVDRAICNLHFFDRKTSPSENNLWKEGELATFDIILKDIDRLYHINPIPRYEDAESYDEFELMVRVEHRGRPLFVELVGGGFFSGFDYTGGGSIFVSFDPNIFTKTIQTRVVNSKSIYTSLLNDGYEVEGRTDYLHTWNSNVCRYYNNESLHNHFCVETMISALPPLKFLCHLFVHLHQKHLHHYTDVLPKSLVASVKDFIVIRDTIEAYDDE